jgi:hypothetical protein
MGGSPSRLKRRLVKRKSFAKRNIGKWQKESDCTMVKNFQEEYSSQFTLGSEEQDENGDAIVEAKGLQTPLWWFQTDGKVPLGRGCFAQHVDLAP